MLAFGRLRFFRPRLDRAVDSVYERADASPLFDPTTVDDELLLVPPPLDDTLCGCNFHLLIVLCRIEQTTLNVPCRRFTSSLLNTQHRRVASTFGKSFCSRADSDPVAITLFATSIDESNSKSNELSRELSVSVSLSPDFEKIGNCLRGTSLKSRRLSFGALSKRAYTAKALTSHQFSDNVTSCFMIGERRN